MTRSAAGDTDRFYRCGRCVGCGSSEVRKCEGAKCEGAKCEGRTNAPLAPCAPNAPYAPCLEFIPNRVLHAAPGAAVAARERSVVAPERVGAIREHGHVADVHARCVRQVEDVPTEAQLLVLRPRHR